MADDTMARQWRACKRFPGYEVSDHGEVRRADSGRLCTPQVHKDGYVAVCFTSSREERAAGAPIQFKDYVHRLVAEAFLGPRPPGHEVDHIDRHPGNNRLDNLRWLPVSANRAREKRPVGTNFAGLGMQARRNLHLGAGVGLAGAKPRRKIHEQASTDTCGPQCGNSLAHKHKSQKIDSRNKP